MRAVVLVLALLVAGCNAPENTGNDASDDGSEPCIRGVLVDETIRPIPNATLTTNHGVSTTTDEQGIFCLELPEGETSITVTTADRTGGMTCTRGGDEPESCTRVRWIE